MEYGVWNIITRAKWRSCVQTKRHEDAQLRRLQRDYERHLVKSASHLKCFPSMFAPPSIYCINVVIATNSKWRQQQYSIERSQSASSSDLNDVTMAIEPHSSFHEHKLNCSEYRLQLYDHEK